MVNAREQGSEAAWIERGACAHTFATTGRGEKVGSINLRVEVDTRREERGEETHLTKPTRVDVQVALVRCPRGC